MRAQATLGGVFISRLVECSDPWLKWCRVSLHSLALSLNPDIAWRLLDSSCKIG